MDLVSKPLWYLSVVWNFGARDFVVFGLNSLVFRKENLCVSLGQNGNGGFVLVFASSGRRFSRLRIIIVMKLSLIQSNPLKERLRNILIFM